MPMLFMGQYISHSSHLLLNTQLPPNLKFESINLPLELHLLFAGLELCHPSFPNPDNIGEVISEV